MAQDAFDDLDLVDEGDDPHFILTVRAQQRIGFPDFLDEFAPLFGRNPAGVERGDVDDFALGQAERGELELGQAAVGDATEFLDESAMESEIRSQHFRNR